jgi:hypothetical protein
METGVTATRTNGENRTACTAGNSTSAITCTGNSATGRTDAGRTGMADTTLTMVESRSPVKNNDIPKERDLHVLATAGPLSVKYIYFVVNLGFLLFFSWETTGFIIYTILYIHTIVQYIKSPLRPRGTR